MTHAELFSLHELKGRLQGRALCLETDIATTEVLISSLVTEVYQAHWTGRLNILQEWERNNTRLLEEVERIIREAKNDRE